MDKHEILAMVGAEWCLIYMNDGADGPEHIIGYSECPHCKERREEVWVYEYPGISLDHLLYLWEDRYQTCWKCNQRIDNSPALSSGETTGREPALPRLWAEKQEQDWDLPF